MTRVAVSQAAARQDGGRHGRRGPARGAYRRPWQALRRRLLSAMAGTALLGSLALVPAAPAAAAAPALLVLTGCGYTQLSDALTVSSGTVIFDLECTPGTSTIDFPEPIPIASGVTATVEVPPGYTATLDGGGSAQLFNVARGGSLSLEGTGGASPSLTLSGGNAAQDGGAVVSDGSLTVSGVLFKDNNAGGNGGAIAAEVNSVGLLVSDSIFQGNTATSNSGSGGAIYDDGGPLSITQSTFVDNQAVCGGAILQAYGSGAATAATVAGSSFTGNTAAGASGAIAAESSSATLTVADSSFTNNTAEGTPHSVGGGGGGALTAGDLAVTVTGSTFSGNQALGGSGAGGAIVSYGPLTVLNSTLTGNTANTSGGGIDVVAALSLVSSTVYANTAAAGAGGDLSVLDGSTATVTNSMLAGASASGGDCAIGPRLFHVPPAILTDGGYNLADDATCGFSAANRSHPSTTASLGPLQDNGGPAAGAPGWAGTGPTATIQTMALQGDSSNDPAIGGGSPTACSAAPPNGSGGFDERGVVRSAQPGSCDIGAYELTPPPASNPETPLYAFSPAPVAAAGTLAAQQAVPVTVSTETYQGEPVPYVPVYMALSPGATAIGFADVGGGVLSAGFFTTDASGQLALAYNTPTTLPAAGGTDALVAQDSAGAATQRATDSYTYLPSGAGTLAVAAAPSSPVVAGSSANTLTFTYTAGAQGTVDGSVYLTMPAGWRAPSLSPSAPGYTTASGGTTEPVVAVSGQQIGVTDVSLVSGHTLTISYTDATAQKAAATGVSFSPEEASSAGAPAAALSGNPTIDVVAGPPAGISESLAPSSAGPEGQVTVSGSVYDRYFNPIQSQAVEVSVAGGTPTTATTGSSGAYSAKVTAPASPGPAEVTATVAGTSPAVTASATLTVSPAPPLSVTTTSLPGGAAGSPYSTTLQASGGITPYSWSLAPGSGPLPAALGLGSVTGAVYGTPAAVGVSFLTVQASDPASQAASKLLALFVTHAGVTVTGSDAGATGAGGVGTATLDTTATAGGGTGAVATAQYGNDPEPGATPNFSSGGAYFDVAVAPGSTFGSLTITRCGASSGQALDWWSGTAWQAVAPATSSFSTASGCLTLTLSASSTPTIAELTGTPFALGTPTAPAAGGGGVATGGGSLSLAPVVSAVSPDTGPAAGGTSVTVTGAHFTGTTALDFGSVAAGTFTVDSDTQITATAPAGSGTVDVTVRTPYGTSATSAADRFTYTVPTAQVAPTAPSFSDVPASYWAYSYIETLAGKGIVAGFPDGTFRPEAPVTRAQFVKMLDLTLGLTIPAAPAATVFSDVPPTAWYAPYVLAAFNAGIVKGTSPTTFSPNADVTREEMAVLVTRALKLTGTASLHFSDDAQIAPWALAGVEAAVAAGYMNGLPNGTFDPAGPATRAQAAKVLALVLQQVAP